MERNTLAQETNTHYYGVARLLTLGSYTGLLCAIAYGAWIYGPDEAGARVVLGLLAASGLLIVLPGLLRGSKRSYQWLCFILLMYFTWYVQALFSGAPPASTAQAMSMADVLRVSATTSEWLALLCVTSCFCAAMIAARGRQ
ncbi:MAG: DUF2069 domain-containing protein [Pseudomonadales bacterium]